MASGLSVAPKSTSPASSLLNPRFRTDRLVVDLHSRIFALVIGDPFCVDRIRECGARPFQQRGWLRQGGLWRSRFSFVQRFRHMSCD